MPFRDREYYSRPYLRWSPDGSKLLFSITRAGPRHEFWLLPWPAAVAKQVLQPLTEAIGDVSWMPDGRHVALEMNAGSRKHLWEADTQSKDVRPLTTGSGSERFPTVRPDGSGIAFLEVQADYTPIIVSLQDGTVRDAEGQTRFDSSATWAMKANVLAWNTIRNGSSEVWVRDANGTERVVASDAMFSDGGTRSCFHRLRLRLGTGSHSRECRREAAQSSGLSHLRAANPCASPTTVPTCSKAPVPGRRMELNS